MPCCIALAGVWVWAPGPRAISAELAAAEAEDDEEAPYIQAEYLRGMLADAYKALDLALQDSDDDSEGPGHQ
jgi:hypothetical protein